MFFFPVLFELAFHLEVKVLFVTLFSIMVLIATAVFKNAAELKY